MKKSTYFASLERWFFKKSFWIKTILIALIAFLVVSGGVILWVATLKIPDLQSFQDKILAGSTQIYDKTGEVMLFNLNENVKRAVVPFSDISQNIKNATIAIEDEKFYTHKGIAFTSIMRAVWVDIKTMSFSQGGSTITQQVIKNSLLTSDKKIPRKIKEWVLALKLERVMSKDDILNLYLNGNPYGGATYGVEEASKKFFSKSAKDVTIAEAAYIAAVSNAPTYFSPYGSHKDKLEIRKDLVLQKMRELGLITQADFEAARAEKVVFKPEERSNIKAPHFVMFIKEYLTEKYGEDLVKNGALKVITTLDYKLQEKAEEIVKTYALKNKKNYNAENAAVVAIDPTNGQILAMVGSRDYFDKEIEGNFNVTTAHRQPGSAFKPFAYVTAFVKGFTPDTVLFDVKTEFSTGCDAFSTPLSSDAVCYSPENYDHKYRGPMSLRNALAQSINVPAVKTMYLAGQRDVLRTAQDLGISSLTNLNQYGLTLVLGGGEVSPLEMTNAYGVFANNGIKNDHTGILKIIKKDGSVLEEFKPNTSQILPEQAVLELNDILRDNNARMPLNGPGSPTDFGNSQHEVALKTGTTNDSRDAWIIGYTPTIVIGAWAGNNNNSPMVKKTSGLIIAPLWREIMNEVLKDKQPIPFKRPQPIDPTLKPILRGVWQGGGTYVDESIPPEFRPQQPVGEIHTILYWVDKNDPKGPPPMNPASDSQFNHWESAVRAWAGIPTNAEQLNQIQINQPPSQTTPVQTGSAPIITIETPNPNILYDPLTKITVSFYYQSSYPLTKIEYRINGNLVYTANNNLAQYSFVPNDVPVLQDANELKVTAYDNAGNVGESNIIFRVRK